MKYKDSFFQLFQQFHFVLDVYYNISLKSVLWYSIFIFPPLVSANSKFIANIIKHESDVYRYSSKIEVFLDSYASKDNDYHEESYKSLVEKLENDTLSIKNHNIYTSEKLSNILYVVLEQIVQAPNLPIKQCQNCGKYFIPSSRQDEVYCEFPDEKGKTCKEKGALETYKKNLENVPALLEYRRSYQKKIMIVSRNKDNKQ